MKEMLTDRVLAFLELEQDLLYGKIPEEKKRRIHRRFSCVSGGRKPADTQEKIFLNFISNRGSLLYTVKRQKVRWE